MWVYRDHQDLIDSKTFDHVVVNDNAQCGLKLIDETLYVVHAGTNDKKDAIDDAVTGSRYTPAGVKVRKGFYHHSRCTWRAVRNLIESIEPEKIVFCGHSLGGAVAAVQAQMCFELFPQHQNTVKLVTFGAPRCFSPAGSGRVDENLDGRISRFVNAGDLVPSVPTAWLWRHTEGLVYLSDSQAYREGQRGIQAFMRNWGNLIRGTVSLAKHHSINEYMEALDAIPAYSMPEVKSPTEGYQVFST